MTSAAIVGAGPNGLAAAIRLAEHGVDVHVIESSDTIGGGTRSEERTLPGVVHDVCSAVHPFAVSSPFFRSLDLESHGLEWAYPEVDVAHPLDGGRAGAIGGSLEDTIRGLGADGGTWRRLFEPLVDHFDDICTDALGPVLALPRHPVDFARFGLRAALPAAAIGRMLRTDEARALFAGNAAHVFRPLRRPLTASVGVMLTVAAHAVGWPVAVGGSSNIHSAMGSHLETYGATIETATTVSSIEQLRGYDIVMFDLSPHSIARICGPELPQRVHAALMNWSYGPGAYKIDLAIEGDLPWTADECRRAGTVHVGGSYEDISQAEHQVVHGTMPQRPFVLVGQQYLCDPSRSSAEANPIWMYAHVPNGYDGDATDSILDQVERFAPGFRDQILASRVTTPAELERYNANYVGGDILTGANTVKQLITRPRAALHSYWLGVNGWFICSAAAPPGAGVHGMGGANAADAALKRLR